MIKVKTVIDRIEEEKAVLTLEKGEIVVPLELVQEFSAGDVIVVTLSKDGNATGKTEDKAKSIIKEIFKGE